jgi:hypothetical protein
MVITHHPLPGPQKEEGLNLRLPSSLLLPNRLMAESFEKV